VGCTTGQQQWAAPRGQRQWVAPCGQQAGSSSTQRVAGGGEGGGNECWLWARRGGRTRWGREGIGKRERQESWALRATRRVDEVSTATSHQSLVTSL